MPTLRPRRPAALVGLVVAGALTVAACGGDDGGGQARVESAAAQSRSDSGEGLPPKLASNLRQADQIVGEGMDAFQRRLRELRGHPVVVNQWASWCTSCRFEFPFFAKATKRYRSEVAFLGLDSQDQQGSAEQFLQEFPVGFPSIFDPDADVAGSLGGGRAWPTTMFFDREGELVNVKIGAYATAELLYEDIERYARGTGG